MLIRCLGLLVLLACTPATAKDKVRLDDHVAEARERMSCRRDTLTYAANRARLRRNRLPKEKGGRGARPPRLVPARPQPRPSVVQR